MVVLAGWLMVIEVYLSLWLPRLKNEPPVPVAMLYGDFVYAKEILRISKFSPIIRVGAWLRINLRNVRKKHVVAFGLDGAGNR